ncbi:MAG: DUF2085 domain-containing protein [Acidobacteria bacterium]|nr:DUF2085 domain-containing protein [Acidobacteriota bacterium]
MTEPLATNLYGVLLRAAHLVCAQNPAHSPHLFGAQLPLCWRCTGILLGSAAFVAWLFTKRRLPALRLSVALALLMPLDVLQAVVTHGDGDNARRLLTGALWGFFAASLALHLFTYVQARLTHAREHGGVGGSPTVSEGVLMERHPPLGDAAP